jgi:mycoredoxin
VTDRKFICPCYRHKQDIAANGRCICGLFVNESYRPPEGMEAPPLRQEGSPWPPIVVYGTTWCRDTLRTRALLNRHGVPYTFVDLDYDDRAADQVMEWNGGYLSTPTLDIGGEIVREPSDEEMARRLGLGE